MSKISEIQPILMPWQLLIKRYMVFGHVPRIIFSACSRFLRKQGTISCTTLDQTIQHKRYAEFKFAKKSLLQNVQLNSPQIFPAIRYFTQKAPLFLYSKFHISPPFLISITLIYMEINENY